MVRGVFVPRSGGLPVSMAVASGSQLLWRYQRDHVLAVSDPADYLLVSALSVSDYDTRYPSRLTIALSAPSNGSVLPASSYSLRILLPPAYEAVLYAFANLTCQINSATTPCTINSKLIALNLTITGTVPLLTVDVDGMVNPLVQTYCDTTDPVLLKMTEFRFEVRDSAGFVRVNKPTSAIQNCLPFRDLRRNVAGSFPATITAGLFYNYSLSVTIPTNNLIVSIASNCSFLAFQPTHSSFSSYSQTTTVGQLSAPTNAPEQAYCRLQFTNYDQGQNLYKYLLPVTVQLVGRQTLRVPLTIPDAEARSLGSPLSFKMLLQEPIADPFLVTISSDSNDS
jgi:hypothetical protein